MIIWLASYPRSGNTLLRIILKSVFELPSFSKHGDAEDIGADPMLAAQVGHQILTGSWNDEYEQLRIGPQQVLVKTHDVPQDDGKAIYIVRDGRASCRSFYRYLRDFPHLKAKFSLRDVVVGFTPFGSWSDHLEDWQPQKRDQTLLVKYEDLISNPAPQIDRIAEFIHRTPLRSWENNFAELHEINPRFFADGAANHPDTALTGDDAGIFWEQHGPWMQQLGYGCPPDISAESRAAYRSWISNKGRQFYNLSARAIEAEQQVWALQPQIEKLDQALSSGRDREAEIAAELRQEKDEQAVLVSQLSRQKIEAEEFRKATEAAQSAAAAELKSLMDAAAFFESELVQARRQLADREMQIALNRQQLAGADQSLRVLEQSKRDVEDARAAVQIRLVNQQLLTTQLHRNLHQKELQNYESERQFAAALEQKNDSNQLLAAAVQELNTRLRMLLTSKLLHLGWFFGLGRTPYWNDPALDELTDLVEMTSGNPLENLQKLDAFFAPASTTHNEMETALLHLMQKGFRPGVVLDVGAAKGYWSQWAASLWPGAEFFMIDPLHASEPHLKKLCEEARFHYLLYAVGDEPGEIQMKVSAVPDSSSLLESKPKEGESLQAVSIRTIDQLLEARQITPPNLVKIDVQGFELKVLQGASKLFECTEVFIIEANLFEFMPGCPRLHELMQFMADREFYPFDFAGFLRRPYQNDLGQTDVVFVNKNSSLVASNKWWDGASALNLYPVPPVLTGGRVISVVICTKDPRSGIFSRVLNSLEEQTISKDRFEVVIVDNASQPPLDLARLRGSREMEMRIVTEPIPGLSRARCTGIIASIAQLLVFVDDDNFLAPDYLEQALTIAHRESRVGIFGGIAEPELEVPIAKWKMPVLPYLGIRNHGDQPITKFSDRWGMWEPIGAGMVARRSVAERFVKMFRDLPQARILGRTRASLLSGEDSLMARAAYRENYACSYQPTLRLTHFLKASRLTTKYMGQVLEGHGRSFVLLQRALGKPVPKMKLRSIAALLLYRLKEVGLAGFITWRWEIGYAKEFRSPTKEIAIEIKPPLALQSASLPISVVLCTRNPRPDLLRRTLESLDKQTLSPGEFELIIVDNASTSPIQIDAEKAYAVRVIQEPQVGHVFARTAGIRAARGETIVFLDDDNFLFPDYLQQALRIAKSQPTIGAFGGIAEPEFEKPPADWKRPLLIYLAVRNCGKEPITSTQDQWGEWEPIGAGLVVRRDVAELFVQIIQTWPGADALGRSERHLMSGDDALFSRAAHRLGYASSYQPALRLVHHIKKDRLHLRYLARLLSGHGRTYVLLNLIMGTPVMPISIWHAIGLIGYRLKHDGRIGPLMWFWDLGRGLESRKHRKDPRAVFDAHDQPPAPTDPEVAAHAA